MAAIASLVYDALTGGLAELTTGAMIAKIVVRTVSGAFLGGLLAKLIVDLLAETGVLNSYAIVRSKSNNPLA
jgi:ABC-type thiamin/hydroxymethylpyrimidine transport system permease subunit